MTNDRAKSIVPVGIIRIQQKLKIQSCWTNHCSTTTGDYVLTKQNHISVNIFHNTNFEKIIPINLDICFRVLEFLLFNKCLYVKGFIIIPLPINLVRSALTL